MLCPKKKKLRMKSKILHPQSVVILYCHTNLMTLGSCFPFFKNRTADYLKGLIKEILTHNKNRFPYMFNLKYIPLMQYKTCDGLHLFDSNCCSPVKKAPCNLAMMLYFFVRHTMNDRFGVKLPHCRNDHMKF